MSSPLLVESDALLGMDVAISVSDSADLARLGLTPRHCDVAVAELGRAILLAGGKITYGGRLRPEGFTQVLMDEVRRFADGREALTICLAEPEHRIFTDEQLTQIDRRFGTSMKLVCLSADGDVLNNQARPPAAEGSTGDAAAGRDRGSIEATWAATALTAMRRYVTTRTSARVVAGGRLSGYQGAMPGVVEEALLSVQARQPVYVAGGFGGAAAAIARTLGHDGLAWAPPDMPAHYHDARAALVQLAAAHQEHGSVPDGLNDTERTQLASTHRPGDIASLVVLGLARLHPASGPDS